MSNRYSITIIKDKQCVKHKASNDLEYIIDYFKLYNTPDYEISIMDLNIHRLIARKDKGLQL